MDSESPYIGVAEFVVYRYSIEFSSYFAVIQQSLVRATPFYGFS